MKLSAQMTLGLAVVFAIACFGGAISGFAALDEITDPTVLADSRGYAWFWTFLGAVAVVFALVSWWMIRTHKEDGQ
ncbi:MAG TPA: hypothetical protein VM051_01150 [Usitatibacter sp.]|nr:hypothetical protein [Usitatibacter sp.]